MDGIRCNRKADFVMSIRIRTQGLQSVSQFHCVQNGPLTRARRHTLLKEIRVAYDNEGTNSYLLIVCMCRICSGQLNICFKQ